jgi:hypothetical protein
MRRSIIALWALAAHHELRAVMALKLPGLKPPGPKPSDLS